MHKNILIVLLFIVLAVQFYAIARLAPEGSGEQCVPLYSQTGLECCQ